jgi:hypothetical protein
VFREEGEKNIAVIETSMEANFLFEYPGQYNYHTLILYIRSEYKTEYRKSFRPFSHYEYAGGRFFPVTVPIYGPGPQGINRMN